MNEPGRLKAKHPNVVSGCEGLNIGGDVIKRRQQDDIAEAQAHWAEYKRRKKEEG